jgi:hypothetical protein
VERPDGRWSAFVVSHPSSKKTLDGWGTRLIFDLTPKNIPQGLKPVFFCWLYRPD